MHSPFMSVRYYPITIQVLAVILLVVSAATIGIISRNDSFETLREFEGIATGLLVALSENCMQNVKYVQDNVSVIC